MERAKGNLEIVVSNDAAQLDGAVTDSDKNQPLAGVQVKVRIDPETEYNGHRLWQEATDQNGHYVIKDHCCPANSQGAGCKS